MPESIEPTNGSSDSWEDIWKHLKNEMKGLSPGVAIVFIIMKIFPALNEFTESLMKAEAEVEKGVTDLIHKLDDIQAQYNQIKNSHSEKEMQDKLRDAINAANAVMKEVWKNPAFKSLKKVVFTQMKSLFEYDQTKHDWVIDKKTGLPQIRNTSRVQETVGSDWVRSWNVPSSKTGPSPSQSPFTDALTALSSSMNSQSAIVKSTLQFDQGNDQQYLGIWHNIVDQFMKQRESAIQAQRA